MNEHETFDDIIVELTNAGQLNLAARIAAALEIDRALVAPARNCDRFATAEEATAAFGGVLPDDIGDHRAFIAWLFAPAEGGAK